MQELMLYVWDNYVEYVHSTEGLYSPPLTFLHNYRLSNASKIIFVGHGSGCDAIMHVVNERSKPSRSTAEMP